MAGRLFGTDGVRGKAGVYPMVPEFALKLGQVAGEIVAKKQRRVAIGKDTRISGDMIEAALTAGFTSVGVDVVLLGVLPTPAVTTMTESLNVDMSIIISASHNPYFDNGIKLKDHKGDKLSNEITAKLEEEIAKAEIKIDADKIGKVIYYENASEDYEKIFKNFSSLKGLKVVIDCANGAFSNIAPKVLEELGAEVIAIGNLPDGYNINKNCGSTNTVLMEKMVVANDADIGIALDGDGDRAIVCDEKGNRVAGDQLIGFFGGYLKSERKLTGNGVVTTEFSNLGMAKYVKSLGLDYHVVDVGEYNIITKMREIGGNVGGEENGHIFLRDYSRSVDGLIVGIKVCEALLKTGKKMSEVFPVFKPFPMRLTNIRFENKDQVNEAVDGKESQKVIKEVRDAMKGGSVVIRKSGTEPVIRLCLQAEDENLVNNMTYKLTTLFESRK
ncbi:MAG: phosphoglucosamine mutase [Lactobacillaceae bacterium]|jgi:phosphoglucosamine mutase|nr:phosphoglucosamine mutase [Lactobacillaceae bacterium]